MVLKAHYVLDDLDRLLRSLNFRSALYVGTLGFEDRSLGALGLLEGRPQIQQYLYVITHGKSTETKAHNERFAKQQVNLTKLRSMVDNRRLKLIDCLVHEPNDAIVSITNEYYDEEKYDLLMLDISTMPKSLLFPLMRRLWDSFFRDLIVVYSTPAEYTTEPLFYEIGEPRIVPGFHGRPRSQQQHDAWIPVLGFEGDAASLTMEWGRFAKVLPIVAFPGYRTGYVDRVVYENRELLRRPEMERIYYSSANNPFRTRYLIEKLLARLSDFNVILSPMGPKPHSLGLCLSAIEHELQVVYAQPWAYNPNYSFGYGTTYGYWIRTIESAKYSTS